MQTLTYTFLVLYIFLVICIGLGVLGLIKLINRRRKPKFVIPPFNEENMKLNIEASSTDSILKLLNIYKYEDEESPEHDGWKIASLESELLFRYNFHPMASDLREDIELYFDELRES